MPPPMGSHRPRHLGADEHAGLDHLARRSALPCPEGGRPCRHGPAAAGLARRPHPHRHDGHHRCGAARAGRGAPRGDWSRRRRPDDARRPAGSGLRADTSGLQLPGATSPRDLRVAADGLDELDDALLDFVLSLIKAQADAAAPGWPIAAIGGLLGLASADNIPDFPITELPAHGVHALSEWLYGIMTTTAAATTCSATSPT